MRPSEPNIFRGFIQRKTDEARLLAFRPVLHIAQRLVLAIEPFALIFVIDDALIEQGQPVFQVIAQQRFIALHDWR